MRCLPLLLCFCATLALGAEAEEKGPSDAAKRRSDRVELIELNHVRDENGKHVFDQLLFWSDYPERGLHVRDWCVVKPNTMLPRKQEDAWETRWSRKGVTYVVRANRFKETTTRFDPEIADPVTFPKVTASSVSSPRVVRTWPTVSTVQPEPSSSSHKLMWLS